MKHEETVNLGIKWLVGVSSSAALGFEDSLRELSLILSLVVSLLTIAHLALNFWEKIKKGKNDVRKGL